MACTSLGSLTFSTSKHASSGTPRAYSMVPMAPSHRSGRSAIEATNGAGTLRGLHRPRIGAERVEHPREHLIGAEPGRIHREVRLPVVRDARLVERVHLL